MSIPEQLQKIQATIPESVSLVAVSKTKPIELILPLYEMGLRDFGESKVQELTDKHASMQKDIRWHMIGHLQRNKVKYIAPFIHLIQSVDSWRLLKEINKEAKKNNRQIPCLLQLHMAKEDTKFGFSEEEITTIIQSGQLKELQHIRIDGLMGMATFTDNTEQVRREFASLKAFYTFLKKEFFADSPHFTIRSMGMSGDYELAIEQGSNMVRIGSLLFGER